MRTPHSGTTFNPTSWRRPDNQSGDYRISEPRAVGLPISAPAGLDHFCPATGRFQHRPVTRPPSNLAEDPAVPDFVTGSLRSGNRGRRQAAGDPGAWPTGGRSSTAWSPPEACGDERRPIRSHVFHQDHDRRLLAPGFAATSWWPQYAWSVVSWCRCHRTDDRVLFIGALGRRTRPGSRPTGRAVPLVIPPDELGGTLIPPDRECRPGHDPGTWIGLPMPVCGRGRGTWA